ncbi:MAG: hypothetical protein AAF282_02160 [Cyanobacteria bacterium P01_A01_bin.15]
MLTTLVGVFIALINLVIRIYGMERDIKHLKRDYMGLSSNLNALVTELERRMDSNERAMIEVRCVASHLSARLVGDHSGGL